MIPPGEVLTPLSFESRRVCGKKSLNSRNEGFRREGERERGCYKKGCYTKKEGIILEGEKGVR